MKRTLPLQLLFAIAAVALMSTAAFAGARCSDDPESCMKSASKPARTSANLASTSASAPATLAPAVTAKKAAPAPVAKKATAKPKNGATRSISPTPGMGVLIQLSTGATGDISWVPANPAEPGAKTSQSWIL